MRRLLSLGPAALLVAALATAPAPQRPFNPAAGLPLPVRVADHHKVEHPELDSDREQVVDEILVRLKPGTTPSQLGDLHQRQGLTPLHQVSQLNLESVRVPAGQAAAVIAALKEEDLVVSAAPHHVLHASADYTPNDTYFPQQWGLRQIHAPAAWSVFRGPGRVTVALLDTGVDSTHPDLQGHLVPGYNFVDDNADTFDDHGHGTMTAGIAGAITDNGSGVASVSFNVAQLLPVKVLDAQGNGSEVMVADGIVWAADHGAKVISMSLGGAGYSQALEDAVRYAWSKGAVLVAAAGNTASASPQYPASDSYVIGVAATDQSDRAAVFSSQGSEVSLAAPGVSILSTMPTYPVTMTTNQGYRQSYDSMSGTSAATPFVSGLAALLIAQSGGSMPAQDVVGRLERSASTVGSVGWNGSAGWGRIDAAAALSGTYRTDATGSLRGQVTDAAGAPLAAAVVSDGAATATTGADGYYRLAGLAAGPQSLTVQSGGKTSTSASVSVQPGADRYLDVQAVAPAGGGGGGGSTGGGGSPTVVNGGFEAASFSGWTASGSPLPLLSRSQVHSGTYSALLGTASGAEVGGDSSLGQTVQITLPSGKTKATLSFWYWAASTDVTPFDAQQVRILDPASGKVLATVLDQAANPRSWQQASFDLTPYAGQSVRLWFNVHQDGAGDPTWMYLDDVQVTYS